MPAYNMLILDKLPDQYLAAILNAVPGSVINSCDPAQAEKYIADTEIMVVWRNMNIRPLLAAAPRLQWVHTLTAGVEDLMFPEFQASKVILTNSRGIHGIPVSEHVLALILAFSRGLNLLLRQQERKLWQPVPVGEIHEKTIGIVGLGSIGREIAKKAKGMNMQVVAVKREMTTELFVDHLYPPDQLNELLAIADYVVVSLPLLPETKNMFTLAEFATMKKSAYFINIGRGGLVVEADLIAALQQGLIKGAGLDVFAREPLPENSPLWEMPNVIITPHLAAISPLYLDRAIKMFTDNLIRFANQSEMLNIIDKQAGY